MSDRRQSLKEILTEVDKPLHKLIDSFNLCEDSLSAAADNLTDIVASRDQQLSDFNTHFLSLIKRITAEEVEQHTPETSIAFTELSVALQSTSFFFLVTQYLSFFPLDFRKDITFVLSNLLRKNAGDIVSFLQKHKDVIDCLISALTRSETALLSGQILRAVVKYPYLAYCIFLSSHFWHFFEGYLHSPNYDIASESFSLIKELLTSPQLREVQDGFFDTNGDVFIHQYHFLLDSENLLTRRRSLKLLSELLMNRRNYNIMMRFISAKENLKVIMNLLRHKSSQITFEAFHIFKIFVVNPKKTIEVANILFKNRAKLIPFLEQFHTDKIDPQFLEEKQLLISTLSEMNDPDPERTVVSTSSPSNFSRLSLSLSFPAQIPHNANQRDQSVDSNFYTSVHSPSTPRATSTGAPSSSSSILLRKHLSRSRTHSHQKQALSPYTKDLTDQTALSPHLLALKRDDSSDVSGSDACGDSFSDISPGAGGSGRIDIDDLQQSSTSGSNSTHSTNSMHYSHMYVSQHTKNKSASTPVNDAGSASMADTAGLDHSPSIPVMHGTSHGIKDHNTGSDCSSYSCTGRTNSTSTGSVESAVRQPGARISSATKHLHHQQSYQRLLAMRQQHQQQQLQHYYDTNHLRSGQDNTDDNSNNNNHNNATTDDELMKPSDNSNNAKKIMPLSDSFRSAMHLDYLSLPLHQSHTHLSDTTSVSAASSSQQFAHFPPPLLHEEMYPSTYSSTFPTPVSTHSLNYNNSNTRNDKWGSYSPAPSPAYYLHYSNCDKANHISNNINSNNVNDKRDPKVHRWSLISSPSAETSPAKPTLKQTNHPHNQTNNSNINGNNLHSMLAKLNEDLKDVQIQEVEYTEDDDED